ncbi:MAG: methylated-DNA--[protein]-cysteine S-methyltransferase [Desulfobacterales bacterium]|nr:methylated-DNA--[protein]-cysteine S-methyltransferase [Desulfobacterales bacterium]MDD4071356.1 methylated-DNA--[protein]-cysteine S-methyltransferase [Desulfobacterales bacterium]MDD4392672.1 methylated-DNA--[protein]-cysteine S-methyltransferase [Desulfobacterales bacterium]
MKLFKTYYSSPIGVMEITGTRERIISVQFVDSSKQPGTDLPAAVAECRLQIDDYFRGGRTSFSVKTDLQGTGFQKTVWRQLEKIPYGRVVSYSDIARDIANPNACRAVGNANHQNPVAIIIPCHRVIGKNGDLIGYGGGLWRKKWLLEHESAMNPKKSVV